MTKMKPVSDILASLPQDVKKSLQAAPANDKFEEKERFPANLSIVNINSKALIPSSPLHVPGAQPGDIVYSADRSKSHKSLRILPLLVYEQVCEYLPEPDGRKSQEYRGTRFDMDVYKKYPEKNKAGKTVLPNGNVLDRQMKVHGRLIWDEKGSFEEGYPPVVITLRGPEVVRKKGGVAFMRSYLGEMPGDSLYLNSLIVTAALESVFDKAMSKFFTFHKDKSLSELPNFMDLKENLKKAYVECIEKLARDKEKSLQMIADRGF